MLDLSPTAARTLKLVTAAFIICVVATVAFCRPNGGAGAQKPAVEAQSTTSPNDGTIVTVSSPPSADSTIKH